MKVKFHSLSSGNRELECVSDVVISGILSSDGKYSDSARKLLSEATGCKDIIMTTSATHALELAAEAAGISAGDEVIMPSYTFPSTANSVLVRGARPVFCEVSPNDLCINPDAIERLISERTKAIIPVHYSGYSCDMDSIMKIAHKFGIQVIEDAAQAIGSRYKDAHLGSIGDFGVISFHATKNIGCGEGGALLLNKCGNDVLQKALVFRDKGTNRAQFLEGKTDKYRWVAKGSNFCPGEMSMAFLCAQLGRIEHVNSSRGEIYNIYRDSLRKYVPSKIASISNPAGKDRTLNHHIFYVVMRSESDRIIIQKFLEEKGIDSRTHFESLHESPMGESLGYSATDFPFESLLSRTLLRLPIHPSMDARDAIFVADSLTEGLEKLI